MDGLDLWAGAALSCACLVWLLAAVCAYVVRAD